MHGRGDRAWPPGAVRGVRSLAAASVAALGASWALNLVVPSAVAPTVAQSLATGPVAGQGDLPLGEQTPLPRTTVIQAPASVTHATGASRARTVAAAARSSIPGPALAAYQRAATVINASDRACAISWELIAAIGKVESDHGRHAGSRLGNDGVARPGIYGIPLDGTHNTRKIRDTDAGTYDRDTRFDRAVGPMQFIPSTWTVVGVDADADGVRNPQDVDDAALATAVYLCSGDEDLSTDAGRESAVLRYNHSAHYVALVTAIADGYARGDFGPATVQLAGVPLDRFEVRMPPLGARLPAPGGATAGAGAAPSGKAGAVATTGPAGQVPISGSPSPIGGSTTPPSSTPSGTPSGTPSSTPSSTPSTSPTPTPSPSPSPSTTLPPRPVNPTLDQAKKYCSDLGYVDNTQVTDDDYDDCVVAVMDPKHTDPIPAAVNGSAPAKP